MIVSVDRPVYGGYTISKGADGRVFLIKGAITGELVDIVIEKQKRDYCIARVIEVKEPSVWRIKPRCGVYGICGGCQLQHIRYDHQLSLKREILRETLKRIGKIETGSIIVRPSQPFNYRFRAQFKIGSGGIGFYKEGTREVVLISECPLMIERINSCIPVLTNLSDIEKIREVHVSSNGRENVIYIKGLNYDERVIDKVAGEVISGISFEDDLYGTECINLSLNDYSYKATARSFFQANWRLNLVLINRMLDELKPTIRCVLDLYAGAGNFSIPFSRISDNVVAVEADIYAFHDLKRNIETNSIKNIIPVNSSVEGFKPIGRYDLIIVDPPRLGLTNKVISLIYELKADLIFYVSCNPSTLARDLKKLLSLYEIAGIELFDFFPNTYHIETLTVLKRR